jgi:hypothetical protein
MSDKKVVPDPSTSKQGLVTVQITGISQVHGLTYQSGKVAGLAIPSPIKRLKFSSSCWSVGLEGVVRITESEGSFSGVSTGKKRDIGYKRYAHQLTDSHKEKDVPTGPISEIQVRELAEKLFVHNIQPNI